MELINDGLLIRHEDIKDVLPTLYNKLGFYKRNPPELWQPFVVSGDGFFYLCEIEEDWELVKMLKGEGFYISGDDIIDGDKLPEFTTKENEFTVMDYFDSNDLIY